DVQVMIEGPGHVSMDKIKEQVEKEVELCCARKLVVTSCGHSVVAWERCSWEHRWHSMRARHRLLAALNLQRSTFVATPPARSPNCRRSLLRKCAVSSTCTWRGRRASWSFSSTSPT